MKIKAKNSILFFDVDKIDYLPLIQSIVKSGFSPILNETSLRREVERAELPFRKWESFTPVYARNLVQEEIIRIAEGLAQELKRPEMQHVFSSSFGNFLSQTGELFVDQLMKLLAEEIATIETLQNLNRSANLKLIVLGCDNNHTERALVLYADRLGIPTLQLAYGINGKVAKGNVASGGRAAGMHTLYSKYVAVFGERSRDDMIEMGNAPERIFVTGCPFWDSLYSTEARIDAKEARKRLGLDPVEPVLVICTSYEDGSSPFFSWISQKVFRHHRVFVDAVNQIGLKVQLILRPHPHELDRATRSAKVAYEIDRLYHRWVKRLGQEQVRIIRDRKIEVIRAADVIVTFGSTSLIPEAMILERPVVMLPWNGGELNFFSEKEGIVIVEDDSRLPEILSDLLAKPKKRKELLERQQIALPEINHENDGKATERVADLIVELATRSTRKSTRRRKNKNFLSRSDAVPSKVSGNLPGLKILEIVHNFPPFSFSGTELYTLNLSKELQKLGHEVTILYPVVLQDKEPLFFESINYEGLNVVQFNIYDKEAPVRSDFHNPSFDDPFQNYLLSQDFHLVHFQHFYGLSASWISIAKALGLPVFLKIDDMFLYCSRIHLAENGKTYCSGPESIDKCFRCMFPSKKCVSPEDFAEAYRHLAFRRAYLKKIFKEIDFVHSSSHFLKSTCIENGFLNDNFHAIPTGISPFEIKQRRIDQSGKMRVAFFGHIDPRKGIQDFLAAIEIYQTQLQISNQPSNLNFVIYGNHYNDELYHDMLSRTKRLKNTKYKGSFEPKDRANIFSEIDLLVMPSIGENYPFILREALYAQIPVVATEIAGVPEIVGDKKNGFLYPPGDVDALAAIFMKLSKEVNPLQQLHIRAETIKTIDVEAKELESEFYRFSKQKPADINNREEQIESLFERGYSLVQDKKWLDGLSVLSKILDLQPKHFDTIHLMGDVYDKLGRKDEALHLWNLALSIRPSNLQLLKKLGKSVECTIIIPVFNQIQFTKNCLDSIGKNSAHDCYEIIVVDNCSTDETAEVLSKLKNIKVIRNEKNLGFAKACNQGAAAAAHEFILFLNNDIEVHEGWLEPLILTLLDDPQVAVVGSKLLYPSGKIQHAGVITVDDREQNKPLDPWHIYHRLDGKLPQANIPREYPAVTGACLLTRKKVFREINGFDPVFRNGFEDVDYCLKVGAAGYKVVYQPKSVATHYESQSGPERFAHNLENFNILVSRWQGKVPVDVMRWGKDKHVQNRPFKDYRSTRMY